tara:strand:+ start:115 stop:486 length:372 start_codon:yes stop_codon:yes gene_type:complete
MKKQLKIILLLISTTLFAQYPDVSYETREIKKEAKKLTKIYDAKLGLDGSQLPIFQDKVEDYLVLSNKVRKDFEGREELEELTKLMVKESLEMKDLLTRVQYQVYKNIRQDIQPLKALKADDE